MAYGQDNQISIHSNTQISPADTGSILNMVRKADSLEIPAPDSAIYWYNLALRLSKEKNFIDGIGNCLQGLGSSYLNKGEWDKATSYFRAAIPYCRKAILFTDMSSTVYGNLGSISYFQGNYKRAALYFDSSLKEGARKGIDPENLYLATIRNNLAGVYLQLDQPQLALKYARKATAIARRKNYSTLLVHALSNQGGIYSKLNNDEQALTYLKESLNISRKNKLRDEELIALNILGDVMLKKEKPVEALAYLQEMGKLTPSPPYYLFIFQGYASGKAYFLLKDYGKAEAELERALAAAEMYNINDNKIEAHKDLSEVYAQSGNYKQAWQQRLIYENLKDSLLNREKARDINELEVRFRTSEKDKELAEKKLTIMHAETLNRKKTTWIWISSLSAIILALSVLLLRYRQKSKEIRQMQQKELELLRATMEGEETERIRVGKELHDGVSGFLSAIKMNLVTLRMQRHDITGSDAYTNALLLADEAADELRKTAHNLVPSLLAKSGLSEAIRGFCRRLSQPGGIQMQVRIMGMPQRLDPEKELAIYRIAQELLHNILKHAQATQVIVAISWLEEILMISIEDNGVGMLLQEQGDGLGMDNIAKRVKSIHGSIETDQGENGGTAIYLYFPLAGRA